MCVPLNKLLLLLLLPPQERGVDAKHLWSLTCFVQLIFRSIWLAERPIFFMLAIVGVDYQKIFSKITEKVSNVCLQISKKKFLCVWEIFQPESVTMRTLTNLYHNSELQNIARCLCTKEKETIGIPTLLHCGTGKKSKKLKNKISKNKGSRGFPKMETKPVL